MQLEPSAASVIYVVWDAAGVGTIFETEEEAAEYRTDWEQQFPSDGPYETCVYDRRATGASKER